MKTCLSLLAVLLVVGCAHEPTSPTTVGAPQPASTQPSSTQPSVATALPEPCSDDDLTVSSGQVESADTVRRVAVSFRNASTTTCTLVGYPGADLVTAAGGILVHVARRPANAAAHLELQPGEVATADVAASAVDAATGEPCGRFGTLVITPPNDVQARLLEVNLPICDATISAVG